MPAKGGRRGLQRYQYSGSFAGYGDNSAEESYYTWLDQHNTLGLGKDVPISTGNENDALLALVEGKWVVLRVPYPLSFYAKGMDDRIDDPSSGWKGRGVWTTSGDRAPWLQEGGKGTVPIAFHFQLRPNPLANCSLRAGGPTMLAVSSARSGSPVRAHEGRDSTQPRPLASIDGNVVVLSTAAPCEPNFAVCSRFGGRRSKAPRQFSP